ncbi:TetR/AcrR family transcriptional regulator [Pseudooceanicola sp.]|uniref:TetR/AcrR family transcriptional regulator n=1 Tax=Pseudooceanicola sp. TaxID=1914328 RepID=UPI0026199A17|nr:TetR/AcrR family transcriptional regulator [Pseudooceanicola sp.]MDF1856435.1 TetR/AcrR family transcriptional regulator [Pseudooceanicola sp.]
MTQPAPPATTKMPSDQRKAQIIDAATQLFANSGYAGTSLRDVAQQCGMTKAALYYHYPDKESLLKSVVSTRMTRLNDLMEQAIAATNSDDPMLRMRAFLLACARYIDQNRSGWVVSSRIFWSIAAISDRTEMVELRDHFESLLRTEVERAMAAGTLLPENPSLVTRLLLSWLNYIPRWHKPDGKLSVEEVAEQFLRLSLNGLLTDRTT